MPAQRRWARPPDHGPRAASLDHGRHARPTSMGPAARPRPARRLTRPKLARAPASRRCYPPTARMLARRNSTVQAAPQTVAAATTCNNLPAHGPAPTVSPPQKKCRGTPKPKGAETMGGGRAQFGPHAPTSMLGTEPCAQRPRPADRMPEHDHPPSRSPGRPQSVLPSLRPPCRPPLARSIVPESESALRSAPARPGSARPGPARPGSARLALTPTRAPPDKSKVRLKTFAQHT